MAARPGLDAPRDQRTHQRRRDVFLEGGQAAAHLHERRREVVELAQGRADARNGTEIEGLDVLELPDDTQERRCDQRIGRQDRERRHDEGQDRERGQQDLGVPLDRRKEVARRYHRGNDPILEAQR